MGMFDDIDTEGPVTCPTCGADVHGFQSKDGPCYLEKLNWREVNNFYTVCEGCQTWIEFTRDRIAEDAPRFEGYTMKTEPPDG